MKGTRTVLSISCREGKPCPLSFLKASNLKPQAICSTGEPHLQITSADSELHHQPPKTSFEKSLSGEHLKLEVHDMKLHGYHATKSGSTDLLNLPALSTLSRALNRKMYLHHVSTPSC